MTTIELGQTVEYHALDFSGDRQPLPRVWVRAVIAGIDRRPDGLRDVLLYAVDGSTARELVGPQGENRHLRDVHPDGSTPADALAAVTAALPGRDPPMTHRDGLPPDAPATPDRDPLMTHRDA